MKKSIRIKLFLGICLLVFCFVTLSWILNKQYLEGYYFTQKKATLVENWKDIDAKYTGEPEEIVIDLERLENTSNMNIIIYGNDMRIKYSSLTKAIRLQLFKERAAANNNPNRINQGLTPNANKLPRNNVLKKELSNTKYFFQMQSDPDLKIEFLMFVSLLNNGDILVMRTPLVSIAESVDIASRFMFYSGIIIMTFGSIWALIFANKFTKPILELNSVALYMSNLDFTKKCSIYSEDEIGELGKSINYLSYQLDSAITELNEKNQRLTGEIEKERKIDQMRKEFISSVSHELKTPISLVQGYAEGLKINVVEDEENKNYYCDVIIDEANKMDKLVRDLLNLSQIESGFFKLERCNFDISLLVEQVLHKYQGILEKKGINLKVDENEDVQVNGDVIRVEQILVNYLNNALNHVDEQKIIRVCVNKSSEDQDKIRVSVFNSGKQIPEESLDKIWTSFYKVDKARTRKYGGYGIGLSVVKAIQELHHNGFGVVNVENGVMFWFDLDKVKL